MAAQEIYDAIVNYVPNTEFTDADPWHPVEEMIYRCLQTSFENWLGKYAGSAIEDVTYPNEVPTLRKGPGYPALTGKRKDLRAQIDAVKLNDKKLPTYYINTLQSYFGAICKIGKKDFTNRVGYLIKLPPNEQLTFVLLSPYNIYAYPLQIKGDPAVLENLAESYLSLLSVLKKRPVEIVNFVSHGDIEFKPADDDQTIRSMENKLTAFVATYMCECIRNWMQLFLSILELGIGRLTTFECYSAVAGSDRFPMAGGGWTSRYSWGGRSDNVRDAGGGPTPIHELPSGTQKSIKQNHRWFLKMIIQDSLDIAAVPRFKDKWWLLLINHALTRYTEVGETEARARVVRSDLIDKNLAALLDYAVSNFPKIADHTYYPDPNTLIRC